MKKGSFNKKEGMKRAEPSGSKRRRLGGGGGKVFGNPTIGKQKREKKAGDFISPRLGIRKKKGKREEGGKRDKERETALGIELSRESPTRLPLEISQNTGGYVRRKNTGEGEKGRGKRS